MSAKLSSFEYTIAGAAPVSLDQILGVRDWIGTLSLRSADSNVGDIYIGDSTMTAAVGRGAYLNPGDAWSFDLVQKFVYSTNIYVLGSPGDKLHIVWIQ